MNDNDDHLQLREELIKAYNENRLPAMASNCMRGEEEAETHACTIDLHNK